MTDVRRLLVTYLDADGSWQRIAPSLVSHLPLNKVEWTNPVEDHRGPRTIPALELDFVPFTPEVFPRSIPGIDLHVGPFLHLYVVGCEVCSQNSGRMMQYGVNVHRDPFNRTLITIGHRPGKALRTGFPC